MSFLTREACLPSTSSYSWRDFLEPRYPGGKKIHYYTKYTNNKTYVCKYSLVSLFASFGQILSLNSFSTATKSNKIHWKTFTLFEELTSSDRRLDQIDCLGHGTIFGQQCNECEKDLSNAYIDWHGVGGSFQIEFHFGQTPTNQHKHYRHYDERKCRTKCTRHAE